MIDTNDFIQFMAFQEYEKEQKQQEKLIKDKELNQKDQSETENE